MRHKATRLSATGSGKRRDPFSRVFLVDAVSGLLLPGFSYSRSGPDLWCPQADGSLKSFAANVAPREWAAGRWGFRFDPGWVNYAQYSTDASNAAWLKTNASVSTSPGSHPISGGVVSKLVESSSLASHIIQTSAITPTAGASYTGRYLLRKSERTKVGIAFTGAGAPDRGIFVDLNNGAVLGNIGAGVASQSVEVLANGDVLVSISETAPGAAGYAVRCYLIENIATPPYTGDGVSGVFILAANHTNTGYPVPLTVAQGTTVTVGNFSAGWDAMTIPTQLGNGFSFGGEASVLNRIASQYPSIINFRPDSLSGSNESVEVFVAPTSKQLFALARTGGVDSYGQAYTGATDSNKFAMRAFANNFHSAFNGVLLPEDLSGAMPLTNYVQVGRNSVANLGAVYIHNLWVSSRALSSVELSSASS